MTRNTVTTRNGKKYIDNFMKRNGRKPVQKMAEKTWADYAWEEANKI